MTLTDQELANLIKPIAETALKGSGLTQLDIMSRLDHDGDPIIEVDAHLSASASRLSPEVKYDLRQKIIDALNARGDDRFPHVLILYAEDDAEPENLYPTGRRSRGGRAS
jgi:hypothetical protein